MKFQQCLILVCLFWGTAVAAGGNGECPNGPPLIRYPAGWYAEASAGGERYYLVRESPWGAAFFSVDGRDRGRNSFLPFDADTTRSILIGLGIAILILLIVVGALLLRLSRRMPAEGAPVSTTIFRDEEDAREFLQPLDEPADNDRTRFGLADDVPEGVQVVSTGRKKKKMPSSKPKVSVLTLSPIEGGEAGPLVRLSSQELKKMNVKLGRNREVSDIVLKHTKVSREHVEIRHDPGEGFLLRDIGSANGTYINKMKLAAQKWTQLFDGDTVLIGGFHYRVVIE